MGKKLIIKGADFSKNGIISETPSENLVLTQENILSAYNFYILSSNVADGNSNEFKGGFIDISKYTGYKTLSIQKAPSAQLARFAFVTKLPNTSGVAISYATGYNTYVTITDDDIHEYSIPNDAKYLYVMHYHSRAGGNIFPNHLALLVE